nr:hypothetical protein HK105_002347 [Polyrhizophydium stewartii]
MPTEIQRKVLYAAGPFTKFVNGRLLKAELRCLPMKQREQVWQDALDVNWQQDLRLLPPIDHNKAKLSLPSRAMLDRLRGVWKDFEWIDAVIRHGWLDMVADCPADDVARAAAKQGAVELLLHAIDVRKSGVPIKSLVSNAAHNGHFELVKLLMDRVPDEKWSSEIATCAAAKGNLDMVIWMDKHHPTSFDSFAMNYAAQFDHLHIMRWLADHRSEGCSWWAFDWAARNNNLEMLEFLYERYRDRLSAETRTYLLLSVSSDKQVIEWLAARELLAPTNLIKYIAGKGKTGILAWAIKRFDIELTERHLHGAFQMHHTALLKWAFTTGGVEFGFWSARELARSCNTDLMSWLVSRDRSVIPLLVRECSRHNHASIVEWWRVRHGVVFGQNEIEAAVAMCNRSLVFRMITEDDGRLDLDAVIRAVETASDDDDPNCRGAIDDMVYDVRHFIAKRTGEELSSASGSDLDSESGSGPDSESGSGPDSGSAIADSKPKFACWHL